MALSFLFGSNKPAKAIGSIQIDAFVEENLNFENSLTDNSVEDGVDITDHVALRPISVTVRGVIPSNKGILPFGGNRRQEVYEQLKELYEARQPIDVVTGLEVFSDMMIVSLNISRNLGNSAGLEFTCELRQIKIVGNQPVSLLGGLLGKKNAGRVAVSVPSVTDIISAGV